ncbi:MAG: hypothetical protein JNL90_01705 [Planctomycetes bacterium]|nr:hypothetical protein [Planctomycetota bacterium]
MHALLLLLLALTAACSSAPPPPLGWRGPYDLDAVRAFLRRAPGVEAARTPPTSVVTRSRVLLYPADGSAPVEATFTLWLRGELQERREIVTAPPLDRTVLQVIDGDRFLELEQGVPTGRDLRDELAVHRRYRRLLADFLADDGAGSGGGAPVELVEAAGAESRTTIVLEQRTPDAARWQLWFDATSGLLRRIRRLTRDGASEHVDEDVLDDHARFDGRVLPRHQVTWRDGRRVMESWLQERVEGEALADDWFALPAGR